MDYTIKDIIEDMIECQTNDLLRRICEIEEQVEKLEKFKAQTEVKKKFDKEFGKISDQRAKALVKGNWTQTRAFRFKIEELVAEAMGKVTLQSLWLQTKEFIRLELQKTSDERWRHEFRTHFKDLFEQNNKLKNDLNECQRGLRAQGADLAELRNRLYTNTD